MLKSVSNRADARSEKPDVRFGSLADIFHGVRICPLSGVKQT